MASQGQHLKNMLESAKTEGESVPALSWTMGNLSFLLKNNGKGIGQRRVTHEGVLQEL